ncbi:MULTISPECIES: LacI family DNA-binding transcriptional regulator [Nocardia]|uniref:LacI family DNA-binding transcriptional regulator n=1 Tax=Nocardia TaxID=1817 RepID=UPI000D687FE3|nr:MULTISPECIES: LacI family DNA-binding transcriptional regulator [Nocardia]
MTYAIEELDALRAATADIERRTMVEIDNAALRVDLIALRDEVAALVPQLNRAIEALSPHVSSYSGPQLREHVEALRALHHTQEEIADAADVSLLTVSRIVRGHRERYSDKVTRRIMALPLEPRSFVVDLDIVDKVIAGKKPTIARRDRAQYLEYLAAREDIHVADIARAMAIPQARVIGARQALARRNTIAA